MIPLKRVHVSRLKSVQYLVICQAGLAVCAEAEAASEDLKRDMLREFELGVQNFTMPTELKGYTREVLLRSKNFVARTCKHDDLHTGTNCKNNFESSASNHNDDSCECVGDTLWRKFKEIKAVIINEFSAIYSRNLPGGQPPSGISYEEILDKTR